MDKKYNDIYTKTYTDIFFSLCFTNININTGILCFIYFVYNIYTKIYRGKNNMIFPQYLILHKLFKIYKNVFFLKN